MSENPTAAGTDLQLFDADEVRRTLQLFLPAGQVTELRVLDASTNSDRWPHTATGYFDDVEKLIDALSIIKSARGIYIVPNPVDPSLLARAANRVRKAPRGESTADNNIVRRHWLLIDADALRASGISASDNEHRAAIKRMKSIADDLHYNYAWPDGIKGDSGNGGHLLFRIDEPADDGGLIEKCLKALASKFADDVVIVDTSVCNASRIWRLYGTLNAKGDSIARRPHRMARILSAPDQLYVVTHAQLEELASEAPRDAPHETNGAAHVNNGTFDIDRFIERHHFEVDGPHAYQGNGRKWTFRTSPMCEHHDDGPFLIQFSSGALCAGCHHDSCRGKWNWHDLRARFEPKQSRNYAEDWPREKQTKDSQSDETQRIVFTRITSAELASGNYEVEFAIENAMVLGAPLTIGGPMKSLKTSLLIDAAISLASGGFFLGKLKVNAPRRVLVMSGESGLATIQETAVRIADAAGVRLPDLGNLIWSPDLPKFSRSDHLEALETILAADGIEVLFCDPAYLAMPSADAGNLMAQGELLRNIGDLCQGLGVSLVLCHHTKRNTGQDAYEPLELQHLAWAGHAEFARQWWLVNRRERYEPGTGEHRLWLSIGGSAGHSALWAADIHEGTLADPGGRYWDVQLSDAAGAREATAERRNEAKATDNAKRLEIEQTAICRLLAKHPNGATKTFLRDRCGVSGRRFPAVFAGMYEAGMIVDCEVTVSNHKTPQPGFKLNSETI